MGGIKNFLPRKNGRIKSGFFKPKNPEKYIGDLNKIIYRSGLELSFFKEMDDDKSVIKWEAEPEHLKVRYHSPIDAKYHTYYPDAYCEKIVNGALVKFLIEVKPKKYVLQPKVPKLNGDSSDSKKRSRFEASKRRFIIIHQKRKSAERLATLKGMKYIFITEDHFKNKK